MITKSRDKSLDGDTKISIGSTLLLCVLALGATLAVSACEGIEIGPVPKCLPGPQPCSDDPDPPTYTEANPAPPWEYAGRRIHWLDTGASPCLGGAAEQWKVHGGRVVRWCSTESLTESRP